MGVLVAHSVLQMIFSQQQSQLVLFESSSSENANSSQLVTQRFCLQAESSASPPALQAEPSTGELQAAPCQGKGLLQMAWKDGRQWNAWGWRENWALTILVALDFGLNPLLCYVDADRSSSWQYSENCRFTPLKPFFDICVTFIMVSLQIILILYRKKWICLIIYSTECCIVTWIFMKK